VEGKEKRTTGAAADEKELASQFLICWENPWGFYTTSLRQFL
jgi:hypothetical protein